MNSRGDVGSGRALRTRLVGEWIARAARQPGVEIMRYDGLAADSRSAGLAPEPFPTLLNFAADAA